MRIQAPDALARYIEMCIRDRFHADRQAFHLRGLRETALETMRFLVDFRPRLVGPVLSGAAGPYASIHLHLFADTPKDPLMFLMEQRVPFETLEHRLRMSNGDQVWLPAFRFNAGDCLLYTSRCV